MKSGGDGSPRSRGSCGERCERCERNLELSRVCGLNRWWVRWITGDSGGARFAGFDVGRLCIL